MTGGKKDWLAFQRELIESGAISEEDLDEFNGKVEILSFSRAGGAGALRADFNGTHAFLRGADAAGDGGEWICRLEKSGGAYIASPIRKVDASFFMELKSHQAEEVAKALWKSRRADMEQIIAEHCRGLLAEEAEPGAGDEAESLRREIGELRAERDSLMERLAEAESLRRERDGLRERLEAGAAAADYPAIRSEVAAEERPQAAPAPAGQEAARRVSEDAIESSLFTPGKCFVHVSLDLETMAVRPHGYGTAICVGNRIRLAGLNAISPFAGERDLACRRGPDGAVTIRLKS
ncbi:MAG: hypothetical protein LBG62_07405 [Candidatus Methanoplasma sp.]|jgi:hypothetical protein|nr:hypothetical protein [Candidatus Methanoplasma sp.]